MKKLKDKHLQKCITGSGWTELGGGEEHARRPDEPGGWLRGNEGKVLKSDFFTTFLPLLCNFHFSILVIFVDQF